MSAAGSPNGAAHAFHRLGRHPGTGGRHQLERWVVMLSEWWVAMTRYAHSIERGDANRDQSYGEGKPDGQRETNYDMRAREADDVISPPLISQSIAIPHTRRPSDLQSSVLTRKGDRTTQDKN